MPSLTESCLLPKWEEFGLVAPISALPCEGALYLPADVAHPQLPLLHRPGPPSRPAAKKDRLAAGNLETVRKNWAALRSFALLRMTPSRKYAKAGTLKQVDAPQIRADGRPRKCV